MRVTTAFNNEWNAHERSHTPKGKWIKHNRIPAGRCSKRRSSSQFAQLATLAEVQQTNRQLYRGFLLKEELRVLYQLDDLALAPEHLDAWLAWASRSRLEPFVRLLRTIRGHRDGILAAIPSASTTDASRGSTGASASA